MNEQIPGELQDVQNELSAARDELQHSQSELAKLQATLREQQKQLLHANKLASLGELVHGIAHEIKTPLGAIHSMRDTLLAAVEKLKRSLGSDENREIQSALRAMENAIQVIALGSSRTLEIVKRVREFAREDEDQQQANLHTEIEDTLLLLQHELRNRIQVHKNFGAIPQIVCNTSRINQVFLNLLLNAVQAIPNQGTIAITTFARQGHVHVLIQDDGVGIPPEHLPRIFTAGFTTKQAADGSGIGLSICRKIVTDHQGHIDLESEPGKGTTVTIRLPIIPTPPDGGPANDTAG